LEPRQQQQQQQQLTQSRTTSSRKKKINLPKIIPLKKWFEHHHQNKENEEAKINVVYTPTSTSDLASSNDKGKRTISTTSATARSATTRTNTGPRGLRVEKSIPDMTTRNATMATSSAIEEAESSPRREHHPYHHHLASFFLSSLLFGGPVSTRKTSCSNSKSAQQKVDGNYCNEDITISFHEEQQQDQQPDVNKHSHASLFQNVFTIDSRKTELQTAAAATSTSHHAHHKSRSPHLSRVAEEQTTTCSESPTPTTTAQDAIGAPGGTSAAIMSTPMSSVVQTAMADASSPVKTMPRHRGVGAMGCHDDIDLAYVSMVPSCKSAATEENHPENNKSMTAPAGGGFSEKNPDGHLSQDHDIDRHFSGIRRPVSFSVKEGQPANSMPRTTTPPAPLQAFSPGNKLRSTSTARTPRISNQQKHLSPSSAPPPSLFQRSTAFSWIGDAKRAIQEAKRNKNRFVASAANGKGVPTVVVAVSKLKNRKDHCNTTGKKRTHEARGSSAFHGKHRNTNHSDHRKGVDLHAVAECTGNSVDDGILGQDESYEHNDGCQFLPSQCWRDTEKVTSHARQSLHKSTSVVVNDTHSVSNATLPFPWLFCNGEEEQGMLHLLSGERPPVKLTASSLSSSTSSSSSSGYRVMPATSKTENLLPRTTQTLSLRTELLISDGGSDEMADAAAIGCRSVASQDQQLVKKYQHYDSYSSVTITMRDAKKRISELRKPRRHTGKLEKGCVVKTKKAVLESWLRFADDSMLRAKRLRDSPRESSFSTHDSNDDDPMAPLKTSFDSDPSSKISPDDNDNFFGIETPFNHNIASLELLYNCLICQDDDYVPMEDDGAEGQSTIAIKDPSAIW
jgi:hypothetical protein